MFSSVGRLTYTIEETFTAKALWSELNRAYSGRTQREKDRLAEAITDDVVKIFNADRKDVIVVYHEEPYGNWYAEGIRL